jgi:hypothetical protein
VKAVKKLLRGWAADKDCKRKRKKGWKERKSPKRKKDRKEREVKREPSSTRERLTFNVDLHTPSQGVFCPRVRLAPDASADAQAMFPVQPMASQPVA